ncbi:hypothetical protein BDZ45DRAFT_808884 [Acephala macrosclerotiorum]|nr:hypothetical protein BDZ45DRAFT_808884 [Acephala macrosclerotiorum]
MFRVSSSSTLDSSQKLGGDVITQIFRKKTVGGHAIFHGWAIFEPYMQQGIRLKPRGSSGSAVTLNSYMESTAIADWGDSNIHFPNDPSGYTVKDPVVAKGASRIFPLSVDTPQSGIAVANTIRLGLKVTLAFQRPWAGAVGRTLPDMSITQALTGAFDFKGTSDSICLDSYNGLEHYATLVDGDYVGWGDDYERTSNTKLNQIGGTDCFANTASRRSENGTTEVTLKKCQNNGSGGPTTNPLAPDLPSLSNLLQKDLYNDDTASVNCAVCGTCSVSIELRGCCGCIWLAPERDLAGATPLYGDWEFASPIKRSILEPNEIDFRDESAADPSLHSFEERALASRVSPGQKTIKACEFEWTSEDYPAYPDFFKDPSNQINFDGNFVDPSLPPTIGYIPGQLLEPKERRTIKLTKRNMFLRVRPYLGSSVTGFHPLQLHHGSASGFSHTSVSPRHGDYNSYRGLLVDERRSVDHQDKLAIFLDRPNGHKARLFRGITAISAGRFGEETAGDAQLTMAREIGMIFTYMNPDPVWETFCDTYKGDLTRLEDFDVWYPTHAGVQSSFATEWPLYIRRELDIVVMNSRSNLKVLNQYRKPASALYTR